MHILILGGSGRNGKLSVQEALSRGHSVTVLLRNPDTFKVSHPALTKVKGSPLVASDIASALSTPRYPDAIISTLAQARVTDSPFSALRPDVPQDMMAQAMKLLLHALSAADTRPKLIINSSQGAGSSDASLPWIVRLLFNNSNMKYSRWDHNEVDSLVRKSGLPFVMARPARLVDTPVLEKSVEAKVWADDGRGVGFFASCERLAVARFLIDAAEKQDWDGRAPVITT